MRSGSQFEKQALVLVCHRLTEKIIEKYEDLCGGFAEMGDVYLLYQKDFESATIPKGVKSIGFSIDDLAEMPYQAIEETIIPGSNHFILMWFAKVHPEYRYYWNVEYDVAFSGKWKVFFDAFSTSNADFISCQIRDFISEPTWYWWKSLYNAKEYIPLMDRVASFNPIYRISSAAVKFIDSKMESGWCGHHEVLLPTLLKHFGYDIEDFGGNSKYTKPENMDKFYNSTTPLPYGTMRHKPEFASTSVDKRKPQLYHPVKI